MENFLSQGKKICRKPLFCRIFLCKVFLIKENFFDQVNPFFGKFPWLKKNFLACGKILWMWKNFLIKKNFLDCGKIIWLLKKSLTVEKFLDHGKHFWLWKTYILDCRKNNGSNILKANANIQTIKTNILSLSFHFPVSFAVDKINILTFTKT